jgi:hypothetical protein
MQYEMTNLNGGIANKHQRRKSAIPKPKNSCKMLNSTSQPHNEFPPSSREIVASPSIIPEYDFPEGDDPRLLDSVKKRFDTKQ